MKPAARVRLIEARKAKYRSASAFARDMGVGRSTVTQWENGDRTPSVTTAAEIAQKLGKPMDHLFGLDALHGA